MAVQHEWAACFNTRLMALKAEYANGPRSDVWARIVRDAGLKCVLAPRTQCTHHLLGTALLGTALLGTCPPKPLRALPQRALLLCTNSTLNALTGPCAARAAGTASSPTTSATRAPRPRRRPLPSGRSTRRQARPLARRPRRSTMTMTMFSTTWIEVKD